MLIKITFFIVVFSLLGCSNLPLTMEAADVKSAASSVKTWQFYRYRNVDKQLTDFSCGAASLATIAKFFLGVSVTGSQVSEEIRKKVDRAEWNEKMKNGMTLLDLKNAAISLGLKAEGFKGSLSDLIVMRGPVIIHLEFLGYKHFTVLKGFSDGYAELADPMLGNIRKPIAELKQEWTGAFLTVWKSGMVLPISHHLQPDFKHSVVLQDIHRQELGEDFSRSIVWR